MDKKRMTTREKLELMKEIERRNEKRLAAWKRKNNRKNDSKREE